MTPYEFLLSESQERMLFVVKSGREEQLMQRFHRWGLQAAVVGRVLDEPLVRVLHRGDVAAEVPAAALADDTPVEQHDLLDEAPADLQVLWQWQERDLPELNDPGSVLLALLDDPTIASKRWVYRQYDQQVLANTVMSSVRRMPQWCVCGLGRERDLGRLFSEVSLPLSIAPIVGLLLILSVARWPPSPKRRAISAVSGPNRLPSPTI